MSDIKYCPFCGSNELLFSDSERFFNCTCKEGWMKIDSYEWWEVQYFEQKLRAMRKSMDLLYKEMKGGDE